MRGVYEPVGSNPDCPEHPLGVMLNELPLGTVLEAQTKHHTYHLENRGEGNVLISGHPTYCPQLCWSSFTGPARALRCSSSCASYQGCEWSSGIRRSD